MSCPRLLEALGDERAADFDQHLQTCAECRDARAAYEAMGDSLPPAPPASLTKARDLAMAELQRRPKAKSWLADAAVVLGANVMIGLGATLGLSHTQLQHSSEAMHFAVAAVWFVVLVAGAVMAVMPRGKNRRAAVAGLALLGAAGTLLSLSGNDPGLGLWQGGVPCGVTELLVAALPLVVSSLLLTRFAFAPSRALAAGLSAGAAGVLALHLHCGNGTTAHQLLFHFVPMLLVAVLAVGVRRLLPSSSYAP